MDSQIDNVLLLERKRLLRLDRGHGILVSNTGTIKAQALVTFILLGISIASLRLSIGFGLILGCIAVGVLYPLLMTLRWELTRENLTKEIRFLGFPLLRESTPTSDLRKGHLVNVNTQYGSNWSIEYQTANRAISIQDLADKTAARELIEFLDELRDWAVSPDQRAD